MQFWSLLLPQGTWHSARHSFYKRFGGERFKKCQNEGKEEDEKEEEEDEIACTLN